MNQPQKTRVLVFGNPLVEKDCVPLLMLDDLRKEFPAVDFAEFDAAEDLEREGRDLVIVDAVEGIPDVKVLTDIDSIIAPSAFTMHDFDLGVTLKLLKKVGMLETVKVVGIPTDMAAKEALPKAIEALRAILPSGSGKRS